MPVSWTNHPIVTGVAGYALSARMPPKKKPRRAKPTGVDGGQIALAVGFGGGSWMSLQPGSNRLLPLGPVGGCTALLAVCRSWWPTATDYARITRTSSIHPRRYMGFLLLPGKLPPWGPALPSTQTHSRSTVLYSRPSARPQPDWGWR